MCLCKEAKTYGVFLNTRLCCVFAGKAADLEGGVPSADAELGRIKRTIVDVEKAVAVATPEGRAEIQKSLHELKKAATNMSEVNQLASAQSSASKQ